MIQSNRAIVKEYHLHSNKPQKAAETKVEASDLAFLDDLNDAQRAAATAPDGPILVVAGAGTGKTKTLTSRVAYLLAQGVPPTEILLMTFTNKAAHEMLHRVELLVHTDIKGLWGGTFHHVGNLVLRRYAALLGYSNDYTILDREDSKSLIELAVKDLEIDTTERRFPKGDVLQDVISFASNTGKSVEDIVSDKYPSFEPLVPEIQQVAARYAEKKRERFAFDYDDLLTEWLRLMNEHAEVHASLAGRFRYLLVDEYQDTNKVQADLVDRLAEVHRNLMVVGDDAQSIYSFRGANFGNIIDFPQRYPDARIFKLERNYRSTREILGLSNASIKHNARQFQKELFTDKGGVHPALVNAPDSSQQATFVAKKILELRDEGLMLDDMAVLFRATHHSMELQLELTRRGIPFVLRGGLRFFEQAHIKDVTAFLRVITNPKDDLAWHRVLRLLPGIGNVTAGRITDVATQGADVLAAIASDEMANLITRKSRESWKEFTDLLGKLDELKGAPSDMIRTVVRDGKYKTYLMVHYPNYMQRLMDLEQLANYAKQFDDTDQFLSDISLQGIIGENVGFDPPKDELLILSTVHQAKGLEWSRVFVIQLADGDFPADRALREDDGEEEERRLFYVACTRAKDELYLVYPQIRLGRGAGRPVGMDNVLAKQSRFISELPRDVYEDILVRPW